MKPYTYLLIDAGAFLVPFIFSFHPKLRFYKEWPRFFPALLFGSGLFIVWDVLFTYMGVWRFNPDYICGVYFINLPIEEVLFFICIPYACVFTYHCFRVFFHSRWDGEWARTFSFVLAILLLITGLIFYDRWYTMVTCIAAALVIFMLKAGSRSGWFGHFFKTWAILLLPFFVVNGLLTGTGLEEAVVIYNDEENTGLRLLTIPVEDIFYGMLLMLLILQVYEKRGNRMNAA